MAVYGLYISKYTCDVKIWINRNPNHYDELYHNFHLQGIVQDRNDYENLLENVPVFVERTKIYYQLSLGESNVTNTSATELVKQHLHFDMRRLELKDSEDMVRKWTIFTNDQHDIFNQNPFGSQRDLVNAMVNVNTHGNRISHLQYFLFTSVRDHQPPIVSLHEAWEHVRSIWQTLWPQAITMKRVGMVFSDTFVPNQREEGNKRKFDHSSRNEQQNYRDNTSKNDNHSKRSNSTYSSAIGYNNFKGGNQSSKGNDHSSKGKSSSIHSTSQSKSAQGGGSSQGGVSAHIKNIICYKCGAEGHKSTECLRKPDCQYLNKEPNVMYRDSKAWKECQKDYKNIIDLTFTPKIPTKKDKDEHEKRYPKTHATSSSSSSK